VTTHSQLEPIKVGEYQCWLAPALEGFTAQLATLPALLDSAEVLTDGRNRNLRLLLVNQLGESCDVAVKQFGVPSRCKQWLDRSRGGKARRTWLAARHLTDHGVGTPPPLACMERWQSGRLIESYYLSRFEADTTSLAAELSRLYHHDPECAHLMTLLQTVAPLLRAMHDSGYLHADLGNQNILLRCDGGTAWRDPMLIDLNRGSIQGQASWAQRGRDLARISLPSDFLRVFIEMYCGDVPPAELLEAEATARIRFARHTRTRRWRHPVRERLRRDERGEHDYPHDRDLWVWDDRSGQALTVHRSRARARLYPIARSVAVVRASLRWLLPVWRRYRELLPTAFSAPVSMAARIGVCVEPRPEIWESQKRRLGELGYPPVMLRAYRHKGKTQWDLAACAVAELTELGSRVSLCLIQDRAAVLDPTALWQPFVEEMLGRCGHLCEHIEIGHTINRVKWGLWDFGEYRRLLAATDAAACGCGDRFIGPSAIDFEYPYILAALSQPRQGGPFAALSHQLYVDRRGAPENPQGGFATVEKAALARAVAVTHPGIKGTDEAKFIISEVNWPLSHTGVHSPVGAPYESPGPRHGDPSVDEQSYADYMLRYLLLTLCSGFVSQVYWWRLAAHGYGLLDDHAASLPLRPAFEALSRLLPLLREATFQRAELPPAHKGVRQGTFAYHFSRTNGSPFTLCYAHPRPAVYALPKSVQRVSLLQDDSTITVEDGSITIDGQLRLVELAGESS
jgi:hypothetical protein